MKSILSYFQFGNQRKVSSATLQLSNGSTNMPLPSFPSEALTTTVDDVDIGVGTGGAKGRGPSQCYNRRGRAPSIFGSSWAFWRKVLYLDLYPSDKLVWAIIHIWAIITYSLHALSDGYKSRYSLRLDTRPSSKTRRLGYAQLIWDVVLSKPSNN